MIEVLGALARVYGNRAILKVEDSKEALTNLVETPHGTFRFVIPHAHGVLSANGRFAGTPEEMKKLYKALHEGSERSYRSVHKPGEHFEAILTHKGHLFVSMAGEGREVIVTYEHGRGFVSELTAALRQEKSRPGGEEALRLLHAKVYDRLRELASQQITRELESRSRARRHAPEAERPR